MFAWRNKTGRCEKNEKRSGEMKKGGKDHDEQARGRKESRQKLCKRISTINDDDNDDDDNDNALWYE